MYRAYEHIHLHTVLLHFCVEKRKIKYACAKIVWNNNKNTKYDQRIRGGINIKWFTIYNDIYEKNESKKSRVIYINIWFKYT